MENHDLNNYFKQVLNNEFRSPIDYTLHQVIQVSIKINLQIFGSATDILCIGKYTLITNILNMFLTILGRYKQNKSTLFH